MSSLRFPLFTFVYKWTGTIWVFFPLTGVELSPIVRFPHGVCKDVYVMTPHPESLTAFVGKFQIAYLFIRGLVMHVDAIYIQGRNDCFLLAMMNNRLHQHLTVFCLEFASNFSWSLTLRQYSVTVTIG